MGMDSLWIAWAVMFFVFIWLRSDKVLSKEKSALIFELLILTFGVLTIVTLIYSHDNSVVNKPEETLIVILVSWLCLFWMYKLFKINDGFEFRITKTTYCFIKSKIIWVWKLMFAR